MAMLNRIRRKRFGEILVGEGLITKNQLQEALALQKSSGDFLGSILVELGAITETDIIKTLSVQYQLPFLRPSLYDIDRRLIQKFKPEFLNLHKVLPIDKIGNLLLLVVTDIPSEEVLAEIQEVSQANLAVYIGSVTEVDLVLKDFAPLSDDEKEGVRKLRTRGQGAQASSSPPSDSSEIMTEAVLETVGDGAEEGGEVSMGDQDLDEEQDSTVITRQISISDSSWEAIFDQAEGKVKKTGGGGGGDEDDDDQ